MDKKYEQLKAEERAIVDAWGNRGWLEKFPIYKRWFMVLDVTPASLRLRTDTAS
jgi:hypothetical protein